MGYEGVKGDGADHARNGAAMETTEASFMNESPLACELVALARLRAFRICPGWG